MYFGAAQPFSHTGPGTQVIYNIFVDAIDYSFSTIYLGNLPAHLTVRDKYLLKILLAPAREL